VVPDRTDRYGSCGYATSVENNLDCFPSRNQSQPRDPRLYKYFVLGWLVDGTVSSGTQCTITLPEGVDTETIPGLEFDSTSDDGLGPTPGGDLGPTMNASSARAHMNRRDFCCLYVGGYRDCLSVGAVKTMKACETLSRHNQRPQHTA
jgi:hypothetical protein